MSQYSDIFAFLFCFSLFAVREKGKNWILGMGCFCFIGSVLNFVVLCGG